MVAVHEADEDFRDDRRSHRPEPQAIMSDFGLLEDIVPERRCGMQPLLLGDCPVCGTVAVRGDLGWSERVFDLHVLGHVLARWQSEIDPALEVSEGEVAAAARQRVQRFDQMPQESGWEFGWCGESGRLLLTMSSGSRQYRTYPINNNSIPGVTVLNVWFAHFDKVVTPVCVNAGRRNNISCCGRVAECQRNRLTLVEMRHNTVKEFHTLFAVHQQLVRTIAPPDLLL